jgi:hypothetical protein
MIGKVLRDNPPAVKDRDPVKEREKFAARPCSGGLY